jgi:hypothetical protein
MFVYAGFSFLYSRLDYNVLTKQCLLDSICGRATFRIKDNSNCLLAYDHCTDEKKNQIFLIFKEIQSGAVAKSYMRKGFLIHEEMR